MVLYSLPPSMGGSVNDVIIQSVSTTGDSWFSVLRDALLSMSGLYSLVPGLESVDDLTSVLIVDATQDTPFSWVTEWWYGDSSIVLGEDTGDVNDYSWVVLIFVLILALVFLFAVLPRRRRQNRR